MDPKKKFKKNVPIKPLVNEENDDVAEPVIVQAEPEPQEEVVEQKKSQIQINKDIEKDVFGFEVHKAKNWLNKQRVLIVASRGINAGGRHLMLDLVSLLPHSKKDSKVEKDQLSQQLNDLCELHSCNNIMFFECRRKRDLYLWMGKFPSGPSVKFHVENIHTTEELKMTGNCLKGSRPLLSFDAGFESRPHYQLLKELLVKTFSTPNFHPKSKPFYDHVFNFSVADSRIWFRNYQIVYNSEEKDLNDVELVEIGPRFVLNPIKVFDGLMSGAVLFENSFFVNPQTARRADKDKKMYEKSKKVGKKRERKNIMKHLEIPQDEVDRLYVDENDDEDYEDME